MLRETLKAIDGLLIGIVDAVDPVESIATIDRLIDVCEGRVAKAAKRWDLTTEDGFSEAVLTVALRMRKEERNRVSDWVRPFRRALEQNWPDLSAKERDVALDEVRALITDLGSRVTQGQRAVLDSFSERVVTDTKTSAIDRYGLGVAPTFTAADQVASNQIIATQVNFIRNREGEIVRRYNEQARGIVAFGVDQGLGRKEIVADLMGTFGDMRSPSYWDFIANHYVNRARAVSSLQTYKTAGITVYKIVSVLDERTTDTCRFLDGKIFDVQSSVDMLQGAYAASAEDPDAIKEQNPFVFTSKDAFGNPALIAKQPEGAHARIAQITRSGVGTVGDRGSYSNALNPTQMTDRGIGPPPYHPFCRTVIVPEFQETAVPVTPRTTTTAPPPKRPPRRPAAKPPIALKPGEIDPKSVKSVREFAAKSPVVPGSLGRAAEVKGSSRSSRKRADGYFEGLRDRGKKEFGDLFEKWEKAKLNPSAKREFMEKKNAAFEMSQRFQSQGEKASTGRTTHEKKKSRFLKSMDKKTTDGIPDQIHREALRRNYDAYGPLADRAEGRLVNIGRVQGRAYYNSNGLIRYRDASGLAHEFNHAIEQAATQVEKRGNPPLKESFWAQFRDHRRGREKLRSLAKDTGEGYAAHEVYVKDKFDGLKEYVRRVYSDDGSTEFVSMLGEMFTRDPNEIARFGAEMDMERAIDESPDVVMAFFGWVSAAVEGAMAK